ncbi:MAG: hypothetical protein Q3979_00725 [Actinomycetaceae bacterium]|nr:hypothetical protein [Actinomycetaceae bacterium]
MNSLDPDPKFDPASMSEDAYLERLYSKFRQDLIERSIRWKRNNAYVRLRREPEIKGRHAIFWHIVSGGSNNEPDRTLDPERCRRIHWIRLLVEQFNIDHPQKSTELHWWISDDPRWQKEPRYVLATLDYDYVVIIQEKRTYALLVTAYYVETPRRRAKFREQHDRYWQKQEPLA